MTPLTVDDCSYCPGPGTPFDRNDTVLLPMENAGIALLTAPSSAV
jgi:hypothetical protein